MTRRRFLLPLLMLSLLGLCLLGMARPAWAQNATELWTDATGAMGDGDDERAVALLAQLVRENPEDALADDALFLAGNLLEEKLARPQDARIQYRQLLEKFPNSRSSLAAKRRLEKLDEGLGEDGAGESVLVEFQDILQGFPDRDKAESLRLAQALAKNNPNWAQIHQVYLWLAATTRRNGDLQAALGYYQKVLDGSAPGPAQVKALLGTAEVSILSGRHDRAEETLRTLELRDDLSPSDGHAVSELGELLISSRRRKTLLTASYAAFFAIQLLFLVLLRRTCGQWQPCWQALRHPNTEVFYMLPVAALFTIMAMTGHSEIGPAVAIICGGGLITTWLVTAVLAASKPVTTARAALCAAASLVATVSVCYVALQRSQLLDLVATTVRFGPE